MPKSEVEVEGKRIPLPLDDCKMQRFCGRRAREVPDQGTPGRKPESHLPRQADSRFSREAPGIRLESESVPFRKAEDTSSTGPKSPEMTSIPAEDSAPFRGREMASHSRTSAPRFTR